MHPSHTPTYTKVDCPWCPRNSGICPTTAAVHGHLILEGNLLPCRTVVPTKKEVDSALVENGMPVSAINKAMANGHNGDVAVCLTTVDCSGIPTRVWAQPRPAGLQRKFFDTGTMGVENTPESQIYFLQSRRGGSRTGSNRLTNDKSRQFWAGIVTIWGHKLIHALHLAVGRFSVHIFILWQHFNEGIFFLISGFWQNSNSNTIGTNRYFSFSLGWYS